MVQWLVARGGCPLPLLAMAAPRCDLDAAFGMVMAIQALQKK